MEIVRSRNWLHSSPYNSGWNFKISCIIIIIIIDFML